MRITPPHTHTPSRGLALDRTLRRPFLSPFQACPKPPEGPFPIQAVIFLKLILSQITETMGNKLCLLKSVWISVTLLMESELKGKPLPLTKDNIRCMGNGLTTFKLTMGGSSQTKVGDPSDTYTQTDGSPGQVKGTLLSLVHGKFLQ